MPFSSPVWNFFWVYGLGTTVLGAVGIYLGLRTRTRSLQLLRQFEREKNRADKLANLVIPSAWRWRGENDLDQLLEKILLEARASPMPMAARSTS